MTTLPLLLAVLAPQQPSLAEAFEVPDGLEVTLWAESPALHNPTAIAPYDVSVWKQPEGGSE